MLTKYLIKKKWQKNLEVFGKIQRNTTYAGKYVGIVAHHSKKVRRDEDVWILSAGDKTRGWIKRGRSRK